jgi:hypothetical protein
LTRETRLCQIISEEVSRRWRLISIWPDPVLTRGANHFRAAGASKAKTKVQALPGVDANSLKSAKRKILRVNKKALWMTRKSDCI